MQDEGEKITMLMVPPPMKGHHFQYLMSTSFTWVYNLASPISSMKDCKWKFAEKMNVECLEDKWDCEANFHLILQGNISNNCGGGRTVIVV